MRMSEAFKIKAKTKSDFCYVHVKALTKIAVPAHNRSIGGLTWWQAATYIFA